MASGPREWIGAAGRRYQFKTLIQERPHLGRVWLSTSGQDKFVLKDIPKNIFSSFSEDIWPQLRRRGSQSPQIRLPFDTIPDQRIFVYKFLDDDFLSLVRKKPSLQARRQILKASLRGIATLHDQDVVHLDIKPDNIMVSCREVGQEETIIDQVQITDLENAAHLPKGRCIKGMLAGNDNWRSPEGHFKGELNKPTDMYSFGAVCIYAILGRIIFGADADLLKHEEQGVFPHLIRLQRQISYFGDKDGVNGLMKYLGDEEINCQGLRMMWDDRNDDSIPYRSFTEWPDVVAGGDDEFKDVVRGLLNLDPAKRITAAQALEHPWFKRVGD